MFSSIAYTIDQSFRCSSRHELPIGQDTADRSNAEITLVRPHCSTDLKRSDVVWNLLPAKQHPTKAVSGPIVRIKAKVLDRKVINYQAEESKLVLCRFDSRCVYVMNLPEHDNAMTLHP